MRRPSIRETAPPVSSVIPTGVSLHHWGFDFGQSSPGRIARASRRRALDASRRATLPRHAAVPLRLSAPGKSGDPLISFRISPGCAGDTAKRHTAHVFSQRSTRRLEATPTRATPKGHKTFIFRAASDHEESFLHQITPITVRDTPSGGPPQASSNGTGCGLWGGGGSARIFPSPVTRWTARRRPTRQGKAP
jgi:hypothetical protein